jgi:glycerophosphoryl diester phosphodiesterase
VKLLRAHAMLDHAAVISFHHPVVRRVKEVDERVATGILYQARLADTVAVARAARADSVRPGWAYVTRALVDEAHAAGLVASTWNANDEARAAYLIALGVDSIGSDYPDRLRAYVDRVGRGWR